MTCGAWQYRPESVGHVRAVSADPFEDPLIQPNYLAAEGDRRVLLAGMRLPNRSFRLADANVGFRIAKRPSSCRDQ